MARAVAIGIAVFAGMTAWPGCTTVDPGPNFVIADQTFNANYFYCFVEPQVIFAESCGSGVAGTDPPNGCHFNSSAVSGMALIQHPAIDCGGGSAPLDETTVGAGSPAQSNLQAVSLEMSVDYLNSNLVVRPTGHNHPRQIFTTSDPVMKYIATWATK